MTAQGFPNLVYIYGPLSLPGYATRPVVVESQAD